MVLLVIVFFIYFLKKVSVHTTRTAVRSHSYRAASFFRTQVSWVLQGLTTRKGPFFVFYAGSVAKSVLGEMRHHDKSRDSFPPFFCVGKKRPSPGETDRPLLEWFSFFLCQFGRTEVGECVVPNICVLYGVVGSALGWSAARQLLEQPRMGGSAGRPPPPPKGLKRPRHADEERNDPRGLPPSIHGYPSPCRPPYLSYCEQGHFVLPAERCVAVIRRRTHARAR